MFYKRERSISLHVSTDLSHCEKARIYQVKNVILLILDFTLHIHTLTYQKS